MAQIRENHMLIQPNMLLDANYGLNKHQTNIIMLGLGLIDTTAVNRTEDAITFDIGELYQLSKTKLRRDRYIKVIIDALKDLKNCPLALANPLTNRAREIPWLAEIDMPYQSNELTVKLYFNQRILDLFSQLKGDYTQCLLRNTMPLETTYAKRIYQMAMQYKPPQNIPEMPLAKFRILLQLADTYPKIHDLNRYVIQPAINDINKQTDIHLKLKTIKIGKTVNALQFTYKFKSKKQAEIYQPQSTKKSFKRKSTKRKKSRIQLPAEPSHAQILQKNEQLLKNLKS